MAAQIHFDQRCKPAQVIVIPHRHEKRRLRLVIFRGDGLKDFVGGPVFHWADAGGVAAKNPCGEGIDLIVGKAHSSGGVGVILQIHVGVVNGHKALRLRQWLKPEFGIKLLGILRDKQKPPQTLQIRVSQNSAQQEF